jgi:hypothetical protein
LIAGYFVCTADWFKEYVYEVVVPRKHTPAELLKILDAGNPQPLPPWVSHRQLYQCDRTNGNTAGHHEKATFEGHVRSGLRVALAQLLM